MSIVGRAQQQVALAIRSGKLCRPANCERCGRSYWKTNAHHPDYLEPLVVIWLCTQCHIKWHCENGPGKNADLSSLASRIEAWGIIQQYRKSFVEELRKQVADLGSYMGPEGLIQASEKLKEKLSIDVYLKGLGI